MAARPLRFAVLGLGIGMHHCRAITAAKGAHLALVCDHDSKRLKEAQTQFDMEGIEDWKALRTRDDIDVVCICTETATHGFFARSLAKAGKHILIEKPADITPARIRQTARAVEKANVACGLCFQLRFDPCNAALKKFLDKGKLGKIYSVHAALPWHRPNSYYEGSHGTWKGTWDIDGGGSLINQGVHTVDLMQWLIGPVDTVAGFHGAFGHAIEAEDQSVAALRFRNGALGTLFTATCAQPNGAQTLTVFGENGSFTKRGRGLERFDAGTKRERETMMKAYGESSKQDAAGADPMRVGSDGHQRVIEDFVRAVRTGRPPSISIDDTIHAVEIVNAVYRSGNTGRYITLGA